MNDNCHVALVPRAVAEAVRIRLAEDGFALGAAPYALYEAIGTDVRVTYYAKKGKLLVQGPGTRGLVLRLGDLLGSAAAPEPSNPAYAVNQPTIGSDEAGKGDYFGSLVVAACCARPEDLAWLKQIGVRDSKESADSTIERVEGMLMQRLPHAVVELPPLEYGVLHAETKNVNVILARAHAQAIARVLEASGAKRVVVDKFGAEALVRRELGARLRGVELLQVSKGEQNPAVAAASFLARACYLRSLRTLSDECGVDLAPGASAAVERVARKVYAVGGSALLAKVAKVHFKTTQRVVD